MRANEIKKTSRRNGKPEEILQEKIITWFKFKFPEFDKKIQGNAILGMFFGEVKRTQSGGKVFVKNVRLLDRIKKTGASKDFPDIAIYLPRGGFHGFFLELKTPENSPILKDGTYSKSSKYKAQMEYGLSLQEDGYFWDFVTNFDQAVKLISDYIEGKILRDE